MLPPMPAKKKTRRRHMPHGRRIDVARIVSVGQGRDTGEASSGCAHREPSVHSQAFSLRPAHGPGENAARSPTRGALAALLDAHLAERDQGVVEMRVRIESGIAERLCAMAYLR